MEKLILWGNGKPVRGLLTVCFCFFSLWSFADPVSLQEAVSIADKNPAKALEILSPYLESNDVFESPEEEFLFHLAAARTFLFTGQFEDALKHVEACLSDGSSKNDLDRCKALILKGLILFRVGEYEKADRCGVEGLEIAKEIGNDQQIASAFNLLGNLQFIQGKLDETISYYVKALDLLDKEEDLYSTVKLRANLGNIFLQLGRFEDARSYLEPCYEIVKESGDAQMLLVIGINLAAVYGELGDIAKERSMYEDALEVGKTSGMDSLLEGVYLNLSDLAIRTSQ